MRVVLKSSVPTLFNSNLNLDLSSSCPEDPRLDFTSPSDGGDFSRTKGAPKPIEGLKGLFADRVSGAEKPCGLVDHNEGCIEEGVREE